MTLASPPKQSPTGSRGRHDAIIIGAGLFGLTTAAFLAQAGTRALLCERAAQVGGLFNSFWCGSPTAMLTGTLAAETA